jgi:hypothetical protein
MRRRWAVTLSAVALISVASAVVPSPATSAPSRPTDVERRQHRPVAPARNGETLGRHPSLAPGQRVVLTVAGFAAHASVDLRIACRPEIIAPSTADAGGRTAIVFTVPGSLPAGAYLFTISGPAATAGGGNDVPRGNAGNVEVGVPRVAFYPFSMQGPGTPPVSLPPPTC